MANEIAKFDPTAYVEAIKGKIKTAIVDAIPDEQWDALVKAEIDKLFTPTTVNHYGDRRTEPSEFAKIVRSVFEDKLKEYVKSLLNSPEWQPRWDGVRLTAGEALQKLLVDNAPQIISSWLATAFTGLVQNLPNRF